MLDFRGKLLNYGDKVAYYHKGEYDSLLRVGFVSGSTPKYIKIRSALNEYGLASRYEDKIEAKSVVKI